MAHHSQQVHALESQEGLPANPRRVQEGRRPRLEHGRRFLREGTPGCGWWKRGAQSQCIGRSRGGLTTKIHALVDSLGRPLHVHLTAGNIHDVSEAPTLIAAQRINEPPVRERGVLAGRSPPTRALYSIRRPRAGRSRGNRRVLGQMRARRSSSGGRVRPAVHS